MASASVATPVSVDIKDKAEESSKDQTKKPSHGSRNFKANVKTNYDVLPESSDHNEIRKQVEFYFSDSNLNYDNYMNELIGGTENKPVPLKTIHNFKRMRRFQPFSAVVEALETSKTLNLVNDNELQRKVAWVKPEINNEFNDPSISKSIYAKGFGEEGTTSQFDIEAFFAPYGPISGVRLRRNGKQDFKGSVFVEFETEELQKQFLDLEDKPKWNGEVLQYKSKGDYVKQKADDIEAGILKPHQKHHYKPYSKPQFSDKQYNKSSRGGGKFGRGNRGGSDRRGRRDHRGKNNNRNHNGPKSNVEDEAEAEAKATQASGATETQQIINEDSKKRDREDDEKSNQGEIIKKVKTDE